MDAKWSTRFELKPGKWVFVPTPEMIQIGKDIKSGIEKRWNPPEFFYHLRPGGHVAALRAHLGSEAFLRLDIQDFFGSIGRTRVSRCLKSRFGRDIAREWSHASTVRDPTGAARTIVPFGFVQSPIVASLCLADSALGSLLKRLHRRKGVKISVYVDDIILSSKRPDELSEDLLVDLETAGRRSRLTFNAEKNQGPGPIIKAFNIELCHDSMRIENGRMAEFIEALKSTTNSPKRIGILGYIGSVNPDQALEAGKTE